MDVLENAHTMKNLDLPKVSFHLVQSHTEKIVRMDWKGIGQHEERYYRLQMNVQKEVVDGSQL